MASFMTDLWESIFVPGPTPTLLRAANATFAALQLLLLILLVATYSVHFIVLSFLCGGLWWSVNWFAAELAASQKREEEKAAAEGKAASATMTTGSSNIEGADESSGDEDTEVEGGGGARKVAAATTRARGGARRAKKAADVEPVDQGEGQLRKLRSTTGTQSSVSTEDEWEKVSGSEKEKDK